MVFLPHSWAGNLPYPPDDVAICDFMLNEKSGRLPFSNSRDPFTCGISGRTYSTARVAQRVEALARALAKEFGWHPNKGSEWEKVVAIYSFNSVSLAILVSQMHLWTEKLMQLSQRLDRFPSSLLGHPTVLRHCLSSKCAVLRTGTHPSA